ncbi:MAG: glycerol-3-phosphate 1-O-acyltransferase PlsY [Elusimicrobiota bacterium]
MSYFNLAVSSILAFLIGAIPFAYLITKVIGKKDIREIGSGNPGATNVVRAMNRWYGLLVMILDTLKGVVPVYIAKQYSSSDPVFISFIAVSVVLGHDFSPYLRFKGGKGVATSFGVFLVIAPLPVLCVLMVFTLVTCVFKFVSFGSVLASIMYPFFAYFMGNTQFVWLAIILGTLIIFRHKENLKRLLIGKEKKSV